MFKISFIIYSKAPKPNQTIKNNNRLDHEKKKLKIKNPNPRSKMKDEREKVRESENLDPNPSKPIIDANIQP